MTGDKDSEDDMQIFEKAMAQTNTSKRNYRQQRFNKYEQRSKPDPKSAVASNQYISTDAPQPIALDQTDLGESVLFVRSGLQRNVVRKLKRGEYPYQSVLDLHGMRVHEAEGELEKFLGDAVQRNLGCVLIIHGKGYHSEGRKGVLKPYTIDWLKYAAQVSAFCSAQPKHGGSGAVYVLLKRGFSQN